jgi:hypothetical protein
MDFANTIKELTHCTLVRLFEHYVHKEADHAFVHRIRDRHETIAAYGR